LNAARRDLRQVGTTEVPKLVVADSGYWNTEQMQRLAAEGIRLDLARLWATHFAVSGLDGGIYDFMRRALATEHGKAL
jgi:hypothetical protein